MEGQNSISTVIITHNESHNIKACLESLGTFSELVVVDSFSDDRTVAIAKSLADRVVDHEWLGFGKQKQLATSLASHNWILSIDADERCTPELRTEISSLCLDDELTAYEIPRTTFFLGKKVKFAWGKDYVIRLFNKKIANFNEVVVHEKVIGYKRLQRLSNNLEHHSYTTNSQIKKKMELYSDLGAQEIIKRRQLKPSWTTIIAKTIFSFVKVFFIRFGALDGVTGYKIACMVAKTTYLKYFKARRRFPR